LTEIATSSLHDALPISEVVGQRTAYAVAQRVAGIGLGESQFRLALFGACQGSECACSRVHAAKAPFSPPSGPCAVDTSPYRPKRDRKSTRLNSSHVKIS